MIPLPEFVHLLRKELDRDVDDLAIPLLGGGASDFPAYREQIGIIAGLRRARWLLDELVKKAGEGSL